MSLTELETIKTFLQIEGTASDSLLSLYQVQVEAEIEAFCNVKLIEEERTEVLKYVTSRADASDYYPFNTRGSRPGLFVDGINITTFTLLFDNTTVSASNYELDNENGYLQTDSFYDDSDKKLQAVYTSGYNTATAPADLQSVVYQGVRAYYTNFNAAKQGAGNVQSKRIKDFSVQYGNASTGLVGASGRKIYLSSNEPILNKYTRISL
jgi:hypothetical protein